MFGVQKPQQFSEVMRLFNEEAEAIDWGGLEVHPFHLNQQEGQFDLTMDLLETTDSFWGALKYDPQLFDRETIERMARHFVHLAEGIAQDPGRAITDYDLIAGGGTVGDPGVLRIRSASRGARRAGASACSSSKPPDAPANCAGMWRALS